MYLKRTLISERSAMHVKLLPFLAISQYVLPIRHRLCTDRGDSLKSLKK